MFELILFFIKKWSFT